MSNYDKEIIDVHSHIFNLNYLPVRGILQSYGVPYPVAVIIAFTIRQFTDNPYKTNRYMGIIDEDSKSFAKDVLEINSDQVIEHIALNVSPEIFYHTTFQSHLESVVEQGLIEINEEESMFMISNKRFSTSQINEKIYNIVKKIFGLIRDGFEWIKWFYFMMRSEERIIEVLYQSYGDDIDYFVFHMMDTQYFFRGKPRLSIKKKIKKIKSYIDNSNGRLIGFIPFNPIRSNGLSIVKGALNDGFRGVKFYPPMGYRATRNDEIVPGIPNIINADLKEKRIRKLFTYCVQPENDVPVFTHCTPTGFQAKPKQNSGRNADPRFWESLLEKPGFENLRLCLGHAGGEEGWATESEEEFKNSYARKVYELCIKYPNVYCEVGFLAHIRNNTEKENFIKRLQRLISKQEGTYNFGKKIMYGSDWHILFNDGLELNYHKRFMEIFENDILKDYQEHFFSLNARKYLKFENNIV